MSRDTKSIRRAAAVRDAASARVRQVTAGAIALAAGLTGVFTAMAASSTHPRRAVTTASPPRVTRLRQPATRPVVAPPPPLVPVRSGDAAQSDAQTRSSAPAPTPQPTPAPVPAPAPAATPVVVSGGS